MDFTGLFRLLLRGFGATVCKPFLLPHGRLWKCSGSASLSVVFFWNVSQSPQWWLCISRGSFLLKVETLSVSDPVLPRRHRDARVWMGSTSLGNCAAASSFPRRLSSLFSLLVGTGFTIRSVKFWTLTSLDSRPSTVLLTFKVWPTMSSTRWERCVLLWETKISESWRLLPTSWRCWG